LRLFWEIDIWNVDTSDSRRLRRHLRRKKFLNEPKKVKSKRSWWCESSRTIWEDSS